jgi:hypothetical protein
LFFTQGKDLASLTISNLLLMVPEFLAASKGFESDLKSKGFAIFHPLLSKAIVFSLQIEDFKF